MSIHVFTPLNDSEVLAAIMLKKGPAEVEIRENGGLIRVDEKLVNFTIDSQNPREMIPGSDLSKVNFYGFEPAERERSLQNTMAVEERMADVIRSIINALKPLEIVEG